MTQDTAVQAAMTDAAAVTTTTGTDVVRSLTFVVLIQTVVSHNDHGDTGEHDHHSATNVWTTSRNRDFVSYFLDLT